VGVDFIGLYGFGFGFGELFANCLKAVWVQVEQVPGGHLVGGFESASGKQLLERFGRNVSGGSKGAEIAKFAGFVCALRVELHLYSVPCQIASQLPRQDSGVLLMAHRFEPCADFGQVGGANEKKERQLDSQKLPGAMRIQSAKINKALERV
jgi:hypothetical protein